MTEGSVEDLVSKEAKREVAGIGLPILGAEMERFRRRYEFWAHRIRERHPDLTRLRAAFGGNQRKSV
jgi:hypothetical protein